MASLRYNVSYWSEIMIMSFYFAYLIKFALSFVVFRSRYLICSLWTNVVYSPKFPKILATSWVPVKYSGRIWVKSNFNPLRAKFFIGNIHFFLQFISFPHTDMIQVVEILRHVGQELTYSTYSPWARPPNFGCRYHLGWIILIVIFG